MERLTNDLKYPLDTFKRCQLCGFTDDDICKFLMWQECNKKDELEKDNIFILCRSKKCFSILNNHERLYKLVPWSAGGPGKFILLCGDCKYRKGTKCINSKLKENGGDGLEVKFVKPLEIISICYYDGTANFSFYVANKCEGKK